MLARLLDAKVLVTSVAPVLHWRGGPIDPVDPPSRHVPRWRTRSARLVELGVAERRDGAVASAIRRMRSSISPTSDRST